MKQNDFKQQVQQSMQSPSLSAEQLAQLDQLQERHKQTNKPQPSLPQPSFIGFGVAATILILIIGSVTLFQPSDNMPQLIANEVAGNHIKLKPLEISSSNMKDIRRYFTQLDFKPVKPVALTSFEQSLTGGRYCSIQGITAAQLRMQNPKTGNLQSLYQTVYNKKKFKELPDINKGQKALTVFTKGIAVDIWVENDLLFALTRDQKAEE